MSGPIHTLSAAELSAAYRGRGLSPVEVARALLDRIGRLDGELVAMALTDPAGALAAAAASEARWRAGTPLSPLDGVPALVKDLLWMTGFPTRRGSLLTEGIAPDTEDAPAVAALRAAGAVLLGKTTTAEFGWKGIGDCPQFGATRNPWSLGHTPGGSSSGSASAVAAGYAPIAIGTDGGGSIRIPSSFTGGVGIKATFARVPQYPPSPFGLVTHTGPMSRTVADAAQMLEILSRPDPRDWLPTGGGAIPAGSLTAGLGQGVAGLKIAFSPTLGYARVDPEVAAAVAAAVALFADLGATVEAADPGFPDPREAFHVLWTAAAAQAMRGYSAADQRRLDPGLQESVARGKLWSAMHLTAADAERMALGATMNRFLATWDLLVTPTVAVPALPIGMDELEPGPGAYWIDWTPFSIPFNLSRHPAITVPCGLTTRGLPIGLQIVGAAHHEALVLRAAAAFEQVRPFALSPCMAKR